MKELVLKGNPLQTGKTYDWNLQESTITIIKKSRKFSKTL